MVGAGITVNDSKQSLVLRPRLCSPSEHRSPSVSTFAWTMPCPVLTYDMMRPVLSFSSPARLLALSSASISLHRPPRLPYTGTEAYFLRPIGQRTLCLRMGGGGSKTGGRWVRETQLWRRGWGEKKRRGGAADWESDAGRRRCQECQLTDLRLFRSGGGGKGSQVFKRNSLEGVLGYLNLWPGPFWLWLSLSLTYSRFHSLPRSTPACSLTLSH